MMLVSVCHLPALGALISFLVCNVRNEVLNFLEPYNPSAQLPVVRLRNSEFHLHRAVMCFLGFSHIISIITPNTIKSFFNRDGLCLL